MRFSLFSLVAGWCAVDCKLQATGCLAMSALFHNQESSLQADKTTQMFYGEEGGRGVQGVRKNFQKREGETEEEMGLN